MPRRCTEERVTGQTGKREEIHWTTILDNQVSRALRLFIGSPAPPADWEGTFTEDPHEPIAEKSVGFFGGRLLIDSHMRRPAEFTEQHRISKRRYIEELAPRSRSTSTSFRDEVTQQKMSFIKEHFLAPAGRVVAAMREGRVPSLGDLASRDSVEQVLRELERLSPDRSDLEAFLLSEQMSQVPFLDVYCTLYAAIDYFQRERNPRASDLDDIPILSTVVPYCQIVTMDSGMLDLCVKAGLQTKYRFESYKSTVEDVERLVAAVSQL